VGFGKKFELKASAKVERLLRRIDSQDFREFSGIFKKDN
jgi:hypothetical protein